MVDDPSPRRQNHRRLPRVLGGVGENSKPQMTGPDEGFSHFVASHSRRLLHIAELLVGPGDAEDLVQGVLLRMYRRWTKIEQHEPLGYARRALANAATDKWRRRRFTEVLVGSVPDTVDVSRAPDEANADRDSILRALASLTPRERAVMVLRYFEDLREEQIGADLGIAVGTVKSTQSRALKKLRASDHLDNTLEEISK
jgi:RNA polymerase sigma-70 factor (sigma-E family)